MRNAKSILTRSEEILLLSILRLRDEAYGATILQEVRAGTGKEMRIGALWVELDILAKKGFVVKRLADPTPQRGGRAKIYYKLTAEGLKALLDTRDVQEALWRGIPEMLKDYR
jgi:PadR family transcriptional regulator PadR